MELLRQLNKKIDEDRKECHKFIIEELNEMNKELGQKLDDIINDNKLFREKLGKEKTEEIKNDSKPEPEKVPVSKKSRKRTNKESIVIELKRRDVMARPLL